MIFFPPPQTLFLENGTLLQMEGHVCRKRACGFLFLCILSTEVGAVGTVKTLM